MGDENDGEELTVDEMDVISQASHYFYVTLEKLRSAKPGDRSEIDRRFAITITEFEKVLAYFDYYICREGHGWDDEGL